MPSVNALPVPANTVVDTGSFYVSNPPRFMAWAEINATDFWKSIFQCTTADMLDHYAQVFARSLHFFIRNATDHPVSELKFLNSSLGYEGQSLINFFGFVRAKQVKRPAFWNTISGQIDPEPMFNDFWAAFWLLGSAFDEEGTLGADFDFSTSVFCHRPTTVEFINACVSYLRSISNFEDLINSVQSEVLSEVHVTAIDAPFMIRFLESRPSILDASAKCLNLTGVTNKIDYLARVVFDYNNILGASKKRFPPSHILRSIQHFKINPVDLSSSKAK
jgi:hypothetical protein